MPYVSTCSRGAQLWLAGSGPHNQERGGAIRASDCPAQLGPAVKRGWSASGHDSRARVACAMPWEDCRAVAVKPGSSTARRWRRSAAHGPTRLGLILQRRLEVLKNQDEDKQVVHRQALLQQVAGKVLCGGGRNACGAGPRSQAARGSAFQAESQAASPGCGDQLCAQGSAPAGGLSRSPPGGTPCLPRTADAGARARGPPGTPVLRHPASALGPAAAAAAGPRRRPPAATTAARRGHAPPSHPAHPAPSGRPW